MYAFISVRFISVRCASDLKHRHRYRRNKHNDGYIIKIVFQTANQVESKTNQELHKACQVFFSEHLHTQFS